MTKLVLRLMELSGKMLGWTEVQAEIRGDGNLTVGPFKILAERGGTATILSCHWADVNVEYRVPILMGINEGQVVNFDGGIVVHVGHPPASLPPVTVGNRSINVPTGVLSAAGNR